MSDLAAAATNAMREACDRTETIINRSLNCNWITLLDREQFKATLRIALDTEVAAGGPYLDNGWNRSSNLPPADTALAEQLYESIYRANGFTINDGENVRRAIAATLEVARLSSAPVSP